MQQILSMVLLLIFSINCYCFNSGNIIHSLKKGVKIRDLKLGKWIDCDTFVYLKNKAIIVTGSEGQADIICSDSSVIFVDTSTVMRVPVITKKAYNFIDLAKGVLTLNKSKSENKYTIRTTCASTAVRGTVLTVRQKDENTTIAVFSGNVDVQKNSLTDNIKKINLQKKQEVNINPRISKLNIEDLSYSMQNYFESSVINMLERTNFYRKVMLELFNEQRKRQENNFEDDREKMEYNYQKQRDVIEDKMDY